MKYEKILNEFFTTPWAIMPEKLQVITSLLMMRAEGGRMGPDEIEAAIGAAHNPVNGTAGSVAVIQAFGVISQRMDLLSEISGGTSTERLAADIKTAIQDPAIGAILLNIDSPGGSVYGIQELGDVIYQARGQKKIVAISNSLAASAAYWIGSAADEFVVTPGGEVGSIGVLTAHTDVSKFEEAVGVKTTLISAGKYKVEGHPYEPLEQEAHEAIQKRIDEYYDSFVKAVARHRGATPADVRSGYGQGRVVGAKEGVALNLVDRVATFDETIARLQTKRGQRNTTNANRLALNERV